MRKWCKRIRSILKPSLLKRKSRELFSKCIPLKAPGVDGFTAGFYQRHWDLVGPELCGAVLGFLNGGNAGGD